MMFIFRASTWSLPLDDLLMHNWKDYLHHWDEIMNKTEMSATILKTKKLKKTTWAAIAKEAGLDERKISWI
jgi:hypothetical protein